MDNRSYLAILAGGALFAAGMAGCDAGDPADPGTPEPESSAMYDTGEADPATDSMTEDRTPAEESMQQARQEVEEQQDRSSADPADSALDSLDSIGTEEVVGKAVVSQQGEEIGEITEIVMDNDSQQHLAVVDVGGFLGIGEKSVAVAFDELQLSDDGRIQSDLTRETLQSQPEYDATQYGEAEDPIQ
ncbi:MAG: PRC-barrel domain-containing protein [Woeseia sp.]